MKQLVLILSLSFVSFKYYAKVPNYLTTNTSLELVSAPSPSDTIKPFVDIYVNGIQGDKLSKTTPNVLTFKSYGYGVLTCTGSANLIITKKGNEYIIKIDAKKISNATATITLFSNLNGETVCLGTFLLKIID